MKKFLIFYTGGTIGMSKTDNGLDVNTDLQNSLLPKIKEYINQNEDLGTLVDAQWDFLQAHTIIDSSNINIAHWKDWIEVISKHLNSYDGILILHGTDTLAYTANILAFSIQNLHKPIVLTGSQIPYADENSDAPLNILTALQHLACLNKHGIYISFGGYIWRGVGSRKYSTELIQGINSPHYKPINKSCDSITHNLNQTTKFITLDKDIVIATYYLTPVGSVEQLIHDLEESNYDAMIIQTYGHGNSPLLDRLSNAIKKYIDSGKIIVNISQVWHGQVASHYLLGKILYDLGVFPGGAWSIEIATTKLLAVLSLTKDYQTAIAMLKENWCGEWDSTDNSEIIYN